MRERRPLFGYGLQRSGMSAVYHSVCERVDFSIRFDTLWHSCGISTRQWKGYTGSNQYVCQKMLYNNWVALQYNEQFQNIISSMGHSFNSKRLYI